MRSWRAFLSSSEGRAAVIDFVVRAASIALPGIAVQRVLFAVTGFGSHRGLTDLIILLGATGAGVYVTHRISRWHERQDRIERERSRQEN